MFKDNSTDLINSKTSTLYITRFLAAVLVVAYHYAPSVIKNSPFAFLIKNGNEAVNYFYFISGFVMVVAYRKELFGPIPFNRLQYWANRLARIYPVYIAAFIFTLLYHFFINPIFSSLWFRAPLEALMIQNWVLPTSINYPGWSISCEFFFYLAFPFTIPILLRWGQKAVWMVVLFWFLMIGLSIMLYSFLVENGVLSGGMLKMIEGILEKHPIFHVSVFFFGGLAGFLYLTFFKKLLVHSLIPILSMVLVGLLMIGTLMTVTTAFEAVALNAGLFAPFYGILVLSMCSLPDGLIKVFNNKVFVFLGDISFGVYIFQYPVHLFYNHFIGSTKQVDHFLAYMIGLILLSALVYWCFEKPAKALIRRHLYRVIGN